MYIYYLTHHEEKPLPSLPAKCPDVTTHGVQSYVMWKINLWQTKLSCTRGYHLKFSSIFCKVLLPHHHSEIENIEQHDGHGQNKGLLSYRHPTTRCWSLILAAPIPHILCYKSAMLSLDISWNPYSTWFSRDKSSQIPLLSYKFYNFYIFLYIFHEISTSYGCPSPISWHHVKPAPFAFRAAVCGIRGGTFRGLLEPHPGPDRTWSSMISWGIRWLKNWI